MTTLSNAEFQPAGAVTLPRVQITKEYPYSYSSFWNRQEEQADKTLSSGENGLDIPAHELQLWQNVFLYVPAQLFPRYLRLSMGLESARQMMPLIFLKSGVFIFETFNNLFTNFSSSLDNTKNQSPLQPPACSKGPSIPQHTVTHLYEHTCTASVPAT